MLPANEGGNITPIKSTEIMNRLNITLTVLAVLLVADLAVFGFVVFFNKQPETAVSSDVIRVGVVPDIDYPESRKVYEDFFRKFGDHPDFRIQPYYASSYGEAVSGFIHGSIDLLLINPACYLTLKEKYNAKAVVYQRFSETEKEYNHAVMLANAQVADLPMTKGMRLDCKDQYAMGGYLVPMRHIILKLGVPAEKWFKELRFTGSDQNSLQNLIDGKTDVIAVNLRSLSNNELYRNNARRFNMFWISQRLPESVLCVSFQSEYFVNSELLQKVTMALWNQSRRDVTFNSNSVMFEPIDFQFEGELKKLEDYLKIRKP